MCTAFCQAGYTISGNATVLICGEGPDSSNGYTEFMPGTEDPGLYHVRGLSLMSFKALLPKSFPGFLLAISQDTLNFRAKPCTVDPGKEILSHLK